MKRYLITVIIISGLVSGLLTGCNGGTPTESSSPESQQRISDLEQQVQSLAKQIDSLEESISSLERELETLPATTSSDIEARIEELGKQIDELNAEVITIKQQQVEQEAEEEVTSSPSAPEAPPGTIFTFSGQGSSQSIPFTIPSSPWKLVLWSNLMVGGSAPVKIEVVDPTQYAPIQGKGAVGIYQFMVEPGISIHETVFYVPAGTYFLNLPYSHSMTWTVWIVEL